MKTVFGEVVESIVNNRLPLERDERDLTHTERLWVDGGLLQPFIDLLDRDEAHEVAVKNLRERVAHMAHVSITTKDESLRIDLQNAIEKTKLKREFLDDEPAINRGIRLVDAVRKVKRNMALAGAGLVFVAGSVVAAEQLFGTDQAVLQEQPTDFTCTVPRASIHNIEAIMGASGETLAVNISN